MTYTEGSGSAQVLHAELMGRCFSSVRGFSPRRNAVVSASYVHAKAASRFNVEKT